MTGQKKSAAIDHFDGCIQWGITKFLNEAIKDEQTKFKREYHPMQKTLQQLCT